MPVRPLQYSQSSKLTRFTLIWSNKVGLSLAGNGYHTVFCSRDAYFFKYYRKNGNFPVYVLIKEIFSKTVGEILRKGRIIDQLPNKQKPVSVNVYIDLSRSVKKAAYR